MLWKDPLETDCKRAKDLYLKLQISYLVIFYKDKKIHYAYNLISVSFQSTIKNRVMKRNLTDTYSIRNYQLTDSLPLR